MRGMEHWLLRPEVREHWRQLQGGWLWCWLSKSQRAMEWKTYFLSTVHMRRWVRVDWSDTLPGELFILSKTKSSIEIKSNGFFSTRRKSPWTKWGCSSPTPTWSSPWGATERIRLNFTIQRLHHKDSASVWFFLSHFFTIFHERWASQTQQLQAGSISTSSETCSSSQTLTRERWTHHLLNQSSLSDWHW